MKFEDLKGKTIIDVLGLYEGSYEALFIFSDGDKLLMHHQQDCCEDVSVADVVGDVHDLIGYPLLLAEEVIGETPDNFEDRNFDSYTWTFYKLATIKGYVDIRWLGESNGYYSESVDLRWV